MSRKSSAEELMNDAEGSDALYGGMTGSKDMMAVVVGVERSAEFYASRLPSEVLRSAGGSV